MANFLTDTFTEASSTTLASHTPDLGGAWAQHPAYTANTFTVGAGTGVVVGSSGAGTSIYRNAATPPSADYSVEAVMQRSGTGAFVGVCGRMSATLNTFYMAYYNDTLGQWSLEKLVGGTNTSLGTYTAGWTTNTSATIKLEMAGTSIKLVLDGVDRVTATDSSITAAGFAGIRGRADGKIYDLGAVGVAAPATATMLAGPSGGAVGAVSGTFTVEANGAITGTVTVTPSDGGGGGTFSPTTVAINTASPAATFTYTAGSAGAKTISITDDGGLTDAASLTYTATVTDGTLASSPLKNNTGTLLLSAACEAFVSNPSTGAHVVKKTGIATDASTGVVTFSHGSLVAATTYRVVWRITADGAEGHETLTAT